MSTTTEITTAEQLLAAGERGRCELIRGRLIMMSPAGGRHGRCAQNLAIAFGAFVKQHKLGVTFTAETGVLIERDPDTVRAPDFAFITAARADQADTPGFIPIAPDLVAEINSPDDRASDVLEKVRLWLAFGVKIVWVVDPKTRTVTIHEPGGHAVVLDDSQDLTAPDLAPRFTIPVAQVFE